MGQREDGDEEEKEEVVRGDGGRRVEWGNTVSSEPFTFRFGGF